MGDHVSMHGVTAVSSTLKGDDYTGFDPIAVTFAEGDTTSDMAPVIDINDNSLTRYTVSNLSVGTHYFAITAYDTDGNESGLSNIASKSAL